MIVIFWVYTCIRNSNIEKTDLLRNFDLKNFMESYGYTFKVDFTKHVLSSS